MGSEMCIRDRSKVPSPCAGRANVAATPFWGVGWGLKKAVPQVRMLLAVASVADEQEDLYGGPCRLELVTRGTTRERHRLERRDVLGTQKERAVAKQVSEAEGGRERQRQLAALVLYEITEGGGETAGEGAA